LAPGEQYLSKADWDAMIGRSINPVLEFKADVKELTASQRELIYYVANKISERKDIKIHIVAQEQENADVTHTRLREIYGELRQAGIESYRIKEDQQSNLIKKGSRGVIEIMLFKTNLQN
jgi:type IV pilus biogenesis protein CpaD/CtpE